MLKSDPVLKRKVLSDVTVNVKQCLILLLLKVKTGLQEMSVFKKNKHVVCEHLTDKLSVNASVQNRKIKDLFS